MKQAQFAVLSAIAILLAVIAFQLTQLERDLHLFRVSSSPHPVVWPEHTETREERNKRLQRMVNEQAEDFRVMMEAAAAPKKAPTKSVR